MGLNVAPLIQCCQTLSFAFDLLFRFPAGLAMSYPVSEPSEEEAVPVIEP